MRSPRWSILRRAVLLPALLVVVGSIFAQGPLTPPGPPAPTMKSLDEVYTAAQAAKDARTPVNTLAGSVDAVHVITQPGSYYLTASITDQTTKNGIQIQADDVTLDLNGFEVSNRTDGRAGIVGVDRWRIVIFGGTLNNNEMRGVEVGPCSRIENLIVYGHNKSGIYTGAYCIVRNCISRSNGGGGGEAGIWVGGGSIVESCTVQDTGAYGIHTSSESIIRDCTVVNSDLTGISTSGNSIVRSCVSRENDGPDIGGSGNLLVDNLTD